jgi:hypothetical protein
VPIRTDKGRPSAKTLQPADYSREIIRFHEERNLSDDLDTATKIARDLSALNGTLPEQEFLKRRPKIVRSIDQHSVRLREALPNVLRHAHAKHVSNLAGCQFVLEDVYLVDAEFLINPQDALRIESRILADAREFRAGLTAQPFQLR